MKPVRVDEITGIFPFIASIDWRNNLWLSGVLLFHVVCLIGIIACRRNHLVQTFIFVSLMVSVYGAEYINEWAAMNYRLFSTEQYFDSNGLFFSVFYSFPALLNCCIVLVLWLYESGLLMFETKKKQIQKQQRQAEPETVNKRERLRRRPRVEEDSTETPEDSHEKKDK